MNHSPIDKCIHFLNHFGMTVDDLSESALAELESKLVADLAMVRRVLALLREMRSGGPAAANPPQVARVPVSNPNPSKSDAECIRDALLALPGDTFRPDELRATMRNEGREPNSARMRIMLAKLVREGGIEVVELGRGRKGSLYRRLISPPAEAIPAPDESIKSGE
jgi:hypothetical protein